MTKPSTLIAAAAVALVAAGTGFFAYRAFLDARAPTALTASTPAVDSPVAASQKKSVPATLPEFTLADREGVPRTLQHWAGRPLLVNFWATWCAPCRREIPLLNSLRTQYAADDLEVIGIAVDFREDVLAYAQEIGIDYPLLIGEQDGLDAAAAFGVEPVFPFSIFSDSQGRIVALRIGELHADEAAFILDSVRRIDAGTLQLPVAQREIAEKLREFAQARAQKAARETGSS